MEDINPIKPPIETPILNKNIIHLFWIILCIIILFIFIFLFYYLWKKRKLVKHKEAIIQNKNKELKMNKYKIVKQKLKEAKKYIEIGDYKTFYIQASEVLREYLTYINGDNFIDMTTMEILKSNKLDKSLHANVEKFLKLSDLIKFAKANQKKETVLYAYKLVVQILDKNI